MYKALGQAWERAAVALAVALVAGMITTQPAQAQTTFKLLHVFTGLDGSEPSAGLVRDPSGNFYGTTSHGGVISRVCPDSLGCGVVFKLDASGAESVLYGFTGQTDGSNPYSGLVRDSSGNFYGTTFLGGDLACPTNRLGCGTVFKLDETGIETVLYSFLGYPMDGAYPNGIIEDAAGNLYGTTQDGGGTVFKVAPSGKETVLYRFTGGADGSTPVSNLIRDAAGNLYGTTLYGGASNYGTVFKVDTATGAETVLHNFAGGSDGKHPYGGLILDAAGNLYGTTSGGGTSGFGIVFKIGAGKEKVLHSFAGYPTDGAYPAASLIRDAIGNLYGTTANSGAFNFGTVFKVSATGKETVLYSFTGGSDGAFPQSSLIRDAEGNLYGTTFNSGQTDGAVFELTFP
jgi:uncharacterized repeat protein (TIGR03803 family)